MSIKLSDLLEAASRFATFKQAHAQADPAVLEAERARLAVTNATQFTSSSDRLKVLTHALRGRAGPPRPEIADAIPPFLDAFAASREVAFGDNDLRPIRYLHVALLAARAVGKLTVRGYVDEEGDASGFLVAPGVLLTNHHVLPSAEIASVSYVAFDYEDGLDGRPKTPKLFDLLPDELFVNDGELDYCFVAVSPRAAESESLGQFGYLRLFEQTGKVDPNQRQAANIIQHPLGQGKRLAMRDNYFAESPKDALDTARVQNSIFYGTDTLSGSSGSPVCTDEWYVVALHRGGVPKTKVLKDGRVAVLRRDGTPARDGDSRASIAYVTNEGTRVSRLYASLRAKVQAGGRDAMHARMALERIARVAANPKTGPVDTATAPIVLPPSTPADAGGIEERLVRRPPSYFDGAQGYEEHFLGAEFGVSLPVLGSEVAWEAAPLTGSKSVLLKYDHYTVVMHARRRTAIYAAANVDGRFLWKNQMGDSMGKRPNWTLDPRMDEAFQPDDTIFSSAMQRGHLFKREDAVWGADAEAMDRADKHSFTITNATPMIADFNNVTWGDLEDQITLHLQAGNRLSYFAGPVFDIEDRYFNQLKAGVPEGQQREGMRVPSCFWKVVAWIEEDQLKAAGFILDQSEDIRKHGPITEEIAFGRYKQMPIKHIEVRTGITFPSLVAADTFA